jgi:hypothetical protein
MRWLARGNAIVWASDACNLIFVKFFGEVLDAG